MIMFLSNIIADIVFDDFLSKNKVYKIDFSIAIKFFNGIIFKCHKTNIWLKLFVQSVFGTYFDVTLIFFLTKVVKS